MAGQQLEFDTVVLPLDENVPAAMEAKAKEGWMLVPGIKPLGIWQICRQPGMAQMLGNAEPKVTVSVDPRKVGILRNGKFVDENGNEVPPPG